MYTTGGERSLYTTMVPSTPIPRGGTESREGPEPLRAAGRTFTRPNLRSSSRISPRPYYRIIAISVVQIAIALLSHAYACARGETNLAAWTVSAVA